MDTEKILNHLWRWGTILLRDIAPLAIGAGAGVRYWIRTRQAVSWPFTQGTVQGARAARIEKGRGRWACVLAYSYVADGQYYSGSYSIRARKEQQAEELAVQWKGDPWRFVTRPQTTRFPCCSKTTKSADSETDSTRNTPCVADTLVRVAQRNAPMLRLREPCRQEFIAY